jgi:UDP-GlcNAc:undecaprenyl-phosphate GlcNAc-1-phosphate transferase
MAGPDMLNMLVLAIFFLFAAAVLPLTWRFLLAHGITAENYRKQIIPTAMGIYLWVVLVLYYLLFAHTVSTNPALSLFFIGASVVFFVGWLDDTIGDKKVKGFKGHLLKFKNEKVVTMGLLKAVSTAGLALWIVLTHSSEPFQNAIAFLLLTLSTNWINLLDLRPGRAIKGFFVSIAMIAAVSAAAGLSFFSNIIYYVFPLAVGALLLLPKDLRAEAMLGDAGANMLGFSLGFCVAFGAPEWVQSAAVIFLLFVHWFAERKSITKYIEEHRFLKWFDEWGRA